MLLQKRFAYMAAGGLLALTLVFGGMVAFAQTDDGEPDSTQTPSTESDSTDQETPVLPDAPWGGHGRGGFGEARGNDSEALAAALGITLEELQAAQAEAHTAIIEQAVADGLLTQEEADNMLQNGNGFHFRDGYMAGDQGEALAAALGITLEELQAAQTQARADELAAMVEAGMLTQEQADLMLAQKAVQNYVDRDALQTAVQLVYETAVADALAAGEITQAQADTLLSNLSNGLGGFGGPGFGDGGCGGHGHHGPGFPGGQAPDLQSAPSTSDSSNG